MEELDVIKPKVIIVDSLQAVAQEDFPELSEDAACLYIVNKLRNWIDENNAVLFLVGHVTKEDTFAGRNTIMQYMDGHIEMIFHKKENYRTISWGQKNRKGPMGTLYYGFGEEGIDIYTENEWKIKVGENRCVLNDIMDTIQSYLNTVDKDSPNYKEFKKEFNRMAKVLEKEYESHGNDMLFVSQMIELIKGLSDEFSL
jgi:hypothetical protein